MEENWITIERPGYLGKKRDETFSYWNNIYGKDNWRIMYQWGSFVIQRREALQIYEDGYYEFFKSNTSKLEWLVSTASDIYDTAPSNVNAGFDYEYQETINNHIHDISIRRAVLRLGKEFHGNHLIHVRDTRSEGWELSPGIVPFHLPNMILKEEIKDYGGNGIWWKSDTIEDFYQRNKILQTRRI